MSTRNLSRMLGGLFKAPRHRQPDPYRVSRPAAKSLAASHDIEIEQLKPGFNVCPLKALAEEAGEFAGDHYANDWDEVLERVRAYVAALAPAKA